MNKKGLSVWIFSSLTFISLIHLIEATTALVFGNQVRLLQLYPIIGEKLQTIAPALYFWLSVTTTLIFWGITCATTFQNPMEQFLSNVLSDAKRQSTAEAQMVEDKSEILDAMYEAVETNNENLAHVKDMVYNVRTEVKEIQPLAENIEKMKAELGNLKKEVRKLEERTRFPNACSACGKPLMPGFKICPYCGESMKLSRTPVLTLKDYK